MSEFIFKNHEFNSHMPFIFEGNKLLYCKANVDDSIIEFEGVRSLMQLNQQTPYRAYAINVCNINLNTGITSDNKEIETCANMNPFCSPSAYRELDENISLTYTKEYITGNRKPFYRGYKKTSDCFCEMEFEPEFIPMLLGVKNYCIAENLCFRVVASSYIGNAYILVFDKIQRTISKIELGLCNFIRRISFESQTNNLLCTYPSLAKGAEDSEAIHNTDVINLDTMETKRIIGEEKSIYKCSIYGNKLIYAYRNTSKESYCMDLKISEFTFGLGRIRPKVLSKMDIK